MMIASLAVVWVVVGLVVAVMFGMAMSRTNPMHDEAEPPKRAGAEVKYMRHAKGTRCQLAKTAMLNPLKKHPAKRRAVV